MSRPKSLCCAELAKQAQADMKNLEASKVILKLLAIIAMSKYPDKLVADMFTVTAATLHRWAKRYGQEGLDGLYAKVKKAKPSKLNPDQKDVVLAWVDACKSPQGEDVHWTLEKLRQSIADEFGPRLALNTIWVWLRKSGRTLKVPRPRHNQADEQAQADFKKTFSDECGSARHRDFLLR